MDVKWDQAVAWRVSNQMLDRPTGRALDVARRLGGVQAQVMSSAELAIGVRTGIAPEAVRTALWADRVLVKTWAMRGTLHLLPADELPTWVAALRRKEESIRRGEAWERYHGISVDQLNRITKTIGDVLGGEPVTREQLASLVVDATGEPGLAEALRMGWGSVLKSAAANGSLCFGPDQGRNVTFVDPKEWLGAGWAEPDPDAAMKFVVWRCLEGYGPAGAEDFAHWWGVPPAAGKRFFKPLTGDLVEVSLEGSRLWVTPSGAEGLAASQPLGGHVRLLPAFDAYVFAPRGHRRHTWPEGLHDRISRTAGWISPCLVVNGRIAGVWAHERVGGRMRIEIEELTSLPKEIRKEAESHARSYESLLGLPVEVAWVKNLKAVKVE